MTALELGIERLAALALILTGLSHVAAPRAWALFFIQLRERGEPAGLLNAYVHAPLGVLIAACHWVWTWPAIVVTLLGWALTLKGLIYFLWPQLALRTMARVSEESAWRFRAAGFPALLLGLWIGWISLRG